MRSPFGAATGSLISQVTRTTLWAVIGGWVLVSVGVGYYVRYEINEGLDNALVDSSHRLLDLAIHDIEEPLIPLSSRRVPAHEALVETGDPNLEDDYLMYQVVGMEGKVWLRSKDAPLTAITSSITNGFTDLPDWRVYTFRHPRKPYLIHIGDSLAHRKLAVRETIGWLLLAMLVMLPLLALLIRRRIANSLAVVSEVADAIGSRHSGHLAPLPEVNLPQELQQIASSTNRLMVRLADALATEKNLASNAAHELRTPLATIRLRLHTLLHLDLNEDALIHLTSALEALELLSRRAERLLQMSKVESESLFHAEVVDLGLLAKAIVHEFSTTSSVGPVVTLTLPEGPMPLIRGDLDALGIALRNLLENAERYGQMTPIEVIVKRPAQLIVRDHGPGVAPGALIAISQRHVRAQGDDKGFGLGLSIVQTIVQKHQGQLQIHSPATGLACGFEAIIDLPLLEV